MAVGRVSANLVPPGEQVVFSNSLGLARLVQWFMGHGALKPCRRTGAWHAMLRHELNFLISWALGCGRRSFGCLRKSRNDVVLNHPRTLALAESFRQTRVLCTPYQRRVAAIDETNLPVARLRPRLLGRVLHRLPVALLPDSPTDARTIHVLWRSRSTYRGAVS